MSKTAETDDRPGGSATLQVTEAAITVLEGVDRPADRVLRLALSDQGILTIVLGKPRPDDVVVDCAGRAMIHVESAISDMVDKAVLDKVYTPDGPTLSIRPASS